MGLDMFLIGRKTRKVDFKKPEEERFTKEDGYDVVERRLDLGYWRKHPNLHGFIVRNFADGVDNCEPIPLGTERLHELITAVKAGALPRTEGFFFGVSDGSDEERAYDIATLQAALDWMKVDDPEDYRDVIYQASW